VLCSKEPSDVKKAFWIELLHRFGCCCRLKIAFFSSDYLKKAKSSPRKTPKPSGRREVNVPAKLDEPVLTCFLIDKSGSIGASKETIMKPS
jgi:hypothetical protein